ncbi:MAG TPA: DNA cytosine methyltransferase [Bacteroidales bacterium]|jgi:DNA (cytosine-5)-methyltransferase 1|nr:DNA cytosine methyltransferase [Bacteroidales bacterium]HPY21757.1 DNA cytosine methyltransferase [Bacteroidales bacterium]
MGTQDYKAVDFFCGGGGMTYGLRQAGIDVVAGVDLDNNAKLTYEYNNLGSVFILKDIRSLESNYFETHFNLQRNDNKLIFAGCSPCQFYSIIKSDKKKSIDSKDLLMDFARFIDYYRPGYVLVENVPGILTHKDSVLPSFLNKIKSIGYNDIVYEVVDMSYHNIPQNRKRFSLIATRLENITLRLPIPENNNMVLKDAIGQKNGFPKVNAGHKDLSDLNHSVAGLSDKNLQRIKKTKHDGGNRLDWAGHQGLQLRCFIGKDDSFKDTYGRMWWDKPAPTITTKFYSISNGRFGHPEEDRAISIREGATIQTFPRDYVFKTNSMATAARLIGNAVPPEYARRLGETIVKS